MILPEIHEVLIGMQWNHHCQAYLDHVAHDPRHHPLSRLGKDEYAILVEQIKVGAEQRWEELQNAQEGVKDRDEEEEKDEDGVEVVVEGEIADEKGEQMYERVVVQKSLDFQILKRDERTRFFLETEEEPLCLYEHTDRIHLGNKCLCQSIHGKPLAWHAFFEHKHGFVYRVDLKEKKKKVRRGMVEEHVMKVVEWKKVCRLAHLDESWVDHGFYDVGRKREGEVLWMVGNWRGEVVAKVSQVQGHWLWHGGESKWFDSDGDHSGGIYFENGEQHGSRVSFEKGIPNHFERVRVVLL